MVTAAPTRTDHELLGRADVDDPVLARIVASALGVDRAEVLSSRVAVSPYDIEALTTAGRYRVSGRARHAGGEADWSVFVKVVRSWRHTEAFRSVPAELQEVALAGLPFDAEPRVYRSDLADRLPPGLSMPRAHAVLDLDADSTALWLEDVPVVDQPWGPDEFARAARLLGRLAASDRVRPLASVADPAGRRTLRGYVEGRVAFQVVPALRDDGLWSHPLLRDGLGEGLRRELLAAVDVLDDVTTELEATPHGVAHGDACARNLLVAADREELVLIDFGFWLPAPLGFDLGQLLLGEVQLGERPAAELPDLEARCVPEYVAGLRDEGCDVDPAVVRRAHALQMLLFTALPSIPFELLGGPVTPQARAVVAERAAGVRFVLDLVAATG